MKKTIILCIFLSLSLSAAKISLTDVIKKGIKINVETKDLSIQEKIDLLTIDISEKKKLFKVDLSGSYLFRSDIMEINFPDTVLSPTMTVPGKSIEAGTYHNFDLNLSIMQPIYTGNIISNNVKLNKNSILIGKSNTKLSNLQISGKIKNSYFKYMILKEEKLILNVLLDELTLHRKKLVDLFKEELIEKSGILETDIRIDEINLNREELEKLIKNEESEFLYMSNTNLNDIEAYTENIPDLKDSLSYYKKNHPVLNKIKTNKSSIDIRNKISKGFYLPQVNGFLKVHYGKPGIDFFKNSWSPYIQTGINVSYKIFDWNKQKKETKIFKYLIQKIENKRSDLIRITEKNLNILFTTKAHLEKNIRRIKKMIRISEEIKDIKEKLFIEKQITNLEYLSLIHKIKQYQISENKTKYNIELIKSKINTYIGKI